MANPVFDGDRLKLGVFCADTMPALTTVPGLFVPDWRECLAVARMADNMELDTLVPIARWKG